MNNTKKRAIYEIARDIRSEWQKPYFGAVPYLNALFSLTDKQSKFGFDNAQSIVSYFLANASTFRGGRAKELKQELKEAVK